LKFAVSFLPKAIRIMPQPVISINIG